MIYSDHLLCMMMVRISFFTSWIGTSIFVVLKYVWFFLSFMGIFIFCFFSFFFLRNQILPMIRPDLELDEFPFNFLFRIFLNSRWGTRGTGSKVKDYRTQTKLAPRFESARHMGYLEVDEDCEIMGLASYGSRSGDDSHCFLSSLSLTIFTNYSSHCCIIQ